MPISLLGLLTNGFLFIQVQTFLSGHAPRLCRETLARSTTFTVLREPLVHLLRLFFVSSYFLDNTGHSVMFIISPQINGVFSIQEILKQTIFFAKVV